MSHATELSTGSSPLTRGKLAVVKQAARDVGLIPAHAGKTTLEELSEAGLLAHPRSRGENMVSVVSGRAFSGSSPLTRGKPPIGDAKLWGDRLIPAHAGKTAGF